MGRQSRLKRQRRTAAFSVLSTGMLEVLSVGKGDLKIEIGNSNKDRAEAQRLIEEMLRKGYTLFTETADGPLKVKKFDPDRMVYIVADSPGIEPEPQPADISGEDADDESSPEQAPTGPADTTPAALPPAGKRGRKPRTVPVAGSRTTAIGRTAGG